MKSSYGREYFEGVNRVDPREKRLICEANLRFLLARKGDVKRVLDVGCGMGEFLKVCEDAGIETYGVDISKHAVFSRSGGKSKLKVWDIEKKQWPYKDGVFDAVCAFDVLEHVKNSDFVISEAYRVLRSGGVFMAATPNGSLEKSAFSGLLPKDPTHINVCDEKSWRSVFVSSGFKNIDISGCLFFVFPPFPKLREYLRKVGIKSWVRPTFFQLKRICATLYLYASKRT